MASFRVAPDIDPVSRRWLLVTGVVLVLLSSLLYVQTLHPGVGPYLDSIQFQITTLVMGISHPPGYPFYNWLGALFVHLLPFGNPAFRLNLLSALSASIVVLLVQRVSYRLTHSVAAATVGALILALAVRFWYQATYTELYPLYNVFVAATWLALLRFMDTRRRSCYFLSVLLYAMAFGINAPAIVLLPMWLWAVLATDAQMVLRLKTLLPTLGIVLGVAAQYLYIPARAFADPPAAFCNFCPEDWQGVVDFWLGRRWWGISFGLPARYWLQRWADSGYQLMLQFWPVGVMAGGVGAMTLLRRWPRKAMIGLLGLAGTWFFVSTYAVVDWDDFLTPVYVFFAPLIAVGLQAFWHWLRDRVGSDHPGWMPMLRAVAGALVGLWLLLVLRNNYPLADQSHKTEWHGWARDLLPLFEEGPWLLTPPTDTDGFVQTWVLRYISWAEDLHPEMTVVYLADGSFDPPGPEPYYKTWAAAQPELANHPVYLIELNDPRVADWVLQPLRRYDDWIIGYRVVGNREGDRITPWVDDDVWQVIQGDLILP